ncbi:MAG TPA: DNA gyrase subunit A [Firmicutes bacterium]|nr:DNA gyrase subunit A [Candidatus Fermentithermobacillaceae bacterium]
MAEDVTRIVPTLIEEEMKRSYIDYSMSVIVSRALPDVRDGLKPVQRRIIYAMDELSLRHDKPHKKSARIVGETMGKYHPHGESAIYDALVRMAQPFNMRYPLVDGHGNFGSVDGDPAAAQRYTEARLTAIAEELLVDIDKETIDWLPNFDDTLKEPTVLPSRIPNLLINGSSGIAVGMATNIPPHNLGEVVDALDALIDNPELSSLELMQYVQGPDFPTGALVVGTDAVRSLYTTGRGILTVRAKTRIERERSGKQTIIVDELPYQVNKARLIESIATLVRDKKIQGVTDLRDESDKKEGLRIVIEVRRDVEAEVVLNQLFKHTNLQTSFGGIMLALVDGRPQVLNLKGMLWHYLMHRKDVVIRRTKFELRKAEERAHILAGLVIALDNLDEVIALIRASATPQAAHQGLMERFGLDDIQAKAILDMRLERLTRLERDKIIEERRQLLKEIEYLKAVLGSERMLMGIIKKELRDVKKSFADPRKTRIIDAVDEIKEEELIVEEEVTVLLTRMGYIKRMPLSVYRSQRRGGMGATAMQTRDEDWVEKVVTTTTRQSLLLFTTSGKAYWLKVYDIPEAGRQAKGYLVSRLVQLAEDERVTAMIPVSLDAEGDLFFVTKNGICKRTPLSEFSNVRRSGLRALTLKPGDSLIQVKRVTDGDEMLIATADGKTIRFAVEDVRAMGREAAGVIGIRLREGDTVVGADSTVRGGLVLLVSLLGYGKVTPLEEFPLHKRGGGGVIALKVSEKSGPLSVMRIVHKEDEMLLMTAEGIAIRTQVSEIKELHRASLGVRVMRIEPPDRLSACSVFEVDDDQG